MLPTVIAAAPTSEYVPLYCSALTGKPGSRRGSPRAPTGSTINSNNARANARKVMGAETMNER